MGMVRERWRAVARVEKTHGRRGEIVAVPAHGLPPLLRGGMEVAVVPPELRESRRLVVADHSDREHGQLVSFCEVQGLGDAATLVGKTLLARTGDLPSGWELLDADLPLGMSVIDERLGEVGVVESVSLGGNGRVWTLTCCRGETLVPAVREVVRGIDVRSRKIRTALPAGLVPWDEVG